MSDSNPGAGGLPCRLANLETQVDAGCFLFGRSSLGEINHRVAKPINTRGDGVAVAIPPNLPGTEI